MALLGSHAGFDRFHELFILATTGGHDMAETKKRRVCPDCDAMETGEFDRRDFLRVGAVATAAAATGGVTLFAEPRVLASPTSSSAAETAVKALFATQTDKQRQEGCFDWDFKDNRGLIRTAVSHNWQITQ